MAKREISEQLRAQILAAIQAGGTCRGVAREFGVSPGFVSKLAKDTGEDTAFDRARTAAATTAAVFDAKAARTKAIAELYHDFERFRERTWGEYTQIVSTPAGPELITTKLPPLPEQRAGITSAAICLDKALALENHDSGDGHEVGRTMINDLFGALRLAHHKIVEGDGGQAPATP